MHIHFIAFLNAKDRHIVFEFDVDPKEANDNEIGKYATLKGFGGLLYMNF